MLLDPALMGDDALADDMMDEQEDMDDQPSVEPGEEGAKGRPPPRKRRRVVISCTECNRRKQKVRRTNCVRLK